MSVGDSDMSSASRYNHSDHLPYLINDVYRSRIEDCVSFSQLVPLMPFMGKKMAQIYTSEKRGERTVAAAVFFSYLQEVDEVGKYQSFVHALRRANYQSLVSALENEDDIIYNEEEHEQLIKIFYKDIIETIDPEMMSQELQMKNVISEDEGESIRNTAARSSKSDACFELLLKIPHRSEDWYKIFLGLLFDYDHRNLVAKIDPKFLAQKMESSANQISTSISQDVSLLTPMEDLRSDTELKQPTKRDKPTEDLSSDTKLKRSRKRDIHEEELCNDAILELQANQEIPISNIVNFVPRERTPDSDSEYKAEVLNQVAELKSMFQDQAKLLKDLLVQTEVIFRRVDSLEHKLDDVQRVLKK